MSTFQHPSQFANLLREVAIRFRNQVFLTMILPELVGRNLIEKVIMRILEPFVDEVIKTRELFHPGILKLRAGLENFIPRAMELLWVNTHMHNADHTGRVNERNADALIVVFVNDICYPHPVGLHVRDLESKPPRPHAAEPSVV